MINTIRSEYLKLRTILAHWMLVAIALAFPLVVVVLASIFLDTEGSGPGSDEISGLVVGVTVVSAMVLGAMSTISLTGDYAHNTIRPTYAATPDRWRVIVAKIVVNSALVGVVSAIAVFGSWLAASLILSARGYSVSIGADGVMPSLTSAVALAVIVSLFGFGLGLIIRNSPVTVTILLLWPLLIESLLGLVLTLTGWGGATTWLPYRAAIGAVADGSSDGDQLGRPLGLIYFAVVSLALVLIGGVFDQRRDA